MTAAQRPDLILIGAGAMARAMVQGWTRHCPFETIYSVDPHQTTGVGGSNNIHLQHPAELPVLSRPFILLFAVKPQVLPDLLPHWQTIAQQAHAVFSLAAGVSCDTLKRGLNRDVMRLMPNTPVAVGSGVVGWYSPIPLKEAEEKNLEAIFAPLGLVLKVNSEDDLNRITALSGSGPAYVYAFLESLAEAAATLNFSHDQAADLALSLVRGSLSLLNNGPPPLPSPADLRRAVTSKGGTTEAALTHLLSSNGGLTDLMTRAVTAAYERAKVLGGG